MDLEELERASRAYRFGLGAPSLSVLAQARSSGPVHQDEVWARRTLALEPVSTTSGDEVWAAALLERAEAILRPSAPGLALRAWAARGRIRLRRGEFAALQSEEDEAESALARTSDAETHVMARIVLAHARAWCGDTDRARAHLADAAVIADSPGFSFHSGLVAAQRGHVAMHDGDLEEAAARADEALAVARRDGLTRLFGLAQWSRGWTQAKAGRPAEAAVSLELAARTQQSLGEWAPAASSWSRVVDLQVIAARDPHPAMRAALRSARNAEGSTATIEVLAALAEAFTRAGAPERADAHIQKLCALAALDPRAEAELRRLRSGRRGIAAELRLHARSVEVCRTGSFMTSTDGCTVDLRRRGAVRKILRRLAQALERTPGEAVASSELLAEGWSSGKSRDLHSAVWTLRRLGLGDALEKVGDGYRLQPMKVRPR